MSLSLFSSGRATWSTNRRHRIIPTRFTMQITHPEEFSWLKNPCSGNKNKMVLEKGPINIPKLRTVFNRTCAAPTSSIPFKARAVQANNSGVDDAPRPQMTRAVKRSQGESAKAYRAPPTTDNPRQLHNSALKSKRSPKAPINGWQSIRVTEKVPIMIPKCISSPFIRLRSGKRVGITMPHSKVPRKIM